MKEQRNIQKRIMSVAALVFLFIAFMAPVAVNAQNDFVGEFTVGTNKFPGDKYSGAYALFAAPDDGEYIIRNTPESDMFGNIDFEIIVSSGVEDPVTDIENPGRQVVECTWETVESYRQTSFQAQKGVKYILYRELTLNEFQCEILSEAVADFTVVPASGSEVSSIETITVSFEQGILFAGDSVPRVYQNGHEMMQLPAPETIDGNTLTFTLENPVTTVATYDVLFPEGCFLLGAQKARSNKTTVTLNVTIPPFVPESADPADGSTIDELTGITFYFPMDVLYKNAGKIVRVYNESNEEIVGDFLDAPDGNSITVRFSRPVFEKGVYTVKFPANAVGDKAWYDNYYTEGQGTSNPEFIYTYTVTGRNSLEPLSITPESGTTIDYEGEKVFRLKFAENIFANPDVQPRLRRNEYSEGTPGTMSVDANDPTVAVLTFSERIDPNASYQLFVPSNAFSNKPFSSDDPEAMFSKQQVYYYNTIPGRVTYDITFDIKDPEGGHAQSLELIELVASMDWHYYDLEKTVTFVKAGTDEKVCEVTNFTFDQDPNSTDYRKVEVWLEHRITEDGEYELVIPEGKIGDEDFALGLGGHANAAARLKFFVGDIPETAYDITFEISEPADGQAQSLQNLELTTSLACQYVDAEKTVTFVKAGTDEEVCEVSSFECQPQEDSANQGKVTVALERLIEEEGEYELVIPEGKIGDEAYSLDRGGHANAAARLKFTVKKKDILSVFADGGTADVYRLDGVLVKKDATAADVRQLIDGIYIIGGKKTAIINE